jgi:hypothetical protein
LGASGDEIFPAMLEAIRVEADKPLSELHTPFIGNVELVALPAWQRIQNSLAIPAQFLCLVKLRHESRRRVHESAD